MVLSQKTNLTRKSKIFLKENDNVIHLNISICKANQRKDRKGAA